MSLAFFLGKSSRVTPEPSNQSNLPEPSKQSNLPEKMVLQRITNEKDLRKVFDMVGQSMISVRYFKNNYPEQHLLINNEVNMKLLNDQLQNVNGNYITYPEKNKMKIQNRNTNETQDLPYTDGMILSYIIKGVDKIFILLIHSDYPDEDTYMAEHPKQDGGRVYIIYNKRKYKVCTGIRGGKYIVVGKDKKKIYI